MEGPCCLFVGPHYSKKQHEAVVGPTWSMALHRLAGPGPDHKSQEYSRAYLEHNTAQLVGTRVVNGHRPTAAKPAHRWSIEASSCARDALAGKLLTLLEAQAVLRKERGSACLQVCNALASQLLAGKLRKVLHAAGFGQPWEQMGSSCAHEALADILRAIQQAQAVSRQEAGPACQQMRL